MNPIEKKLLEASKRGAQQAPSSGEVGTPKTPKHRKKGPSGTSLALRGVAAPQVAVRGRTKRSSRRRGRG